MELEVGPERIMNAQDAVSRTNEAFWEREAARGDSHCTAWLDLERDAILRYVSGALDPIPDTLAKVYPPSVLDGVAGTDVLCLASGGGQQSAIFGLLGARVTVKAGATVQTQDVGDNEGSKSGQGHYRLYYGLGKAGVADSVEVVWQDGKRTSLSNVNADQILKIRY